MVSDAVVPHSPQEEATAKPNFFDLITERRLFWGLTALIAFAPLPLGSNRPIWWSVLAIWAGALFIAYGVLAWRAPSPDHIPARKVLAIVVPFFLAVAWGLLQIFPWMPDSIAHPLWKETQTFIGGAVSSTVSINPYESVTGVMRLLTYAAIFWLALQLGRDGSLAHRGLRAIAVISLAYGAYGLIVHLAGWERVLWFHKWAYEGYLASTFVNRNSYATYAGVGLVCVLGLLMHDLGNILKLTASARTKIELSLEVLAGKSAYLVVGALVLSTAILMTGSRAGAMSTLIGIIILIVCCGYARVIPRQQTLIFLGVAVSSALVFLAVSGGAVVERLGSLEETNGGRSEIYTLTWEAIGAAPVTGSGLGTFSDTYPIFRDERLPAGPPWQDTHNTYLENALELGVPAAALLFVAVASMGELCFFGLLRRRRSKIYAAIGLSVLTLVGVHALVDFSLEIPAVTATFVFIMGLSCAQSFSSRTRHKRARAHGTKSRRSQRRQRSSTTAPAAPELTVEVEVPPEDPAPQEPTGTPAPPSPPAPPATSSAEEIVAPDTDGSAPKSHS